MGRCIISYQEVLRCLLKNLNDQAHEAVIFNQTIDGQLLRTSGTDLASLFGGAVKFLLIAKF
jgi:hypothetical protein